MNRNVDDLELAPYSFADEMKDKSLNLTVKMFNRIYIKDVAEQLNFKDTRSIKKWCSNYGVAILTDVGSNKTYVLKEEFEFAIQREAIKYLKEKYVRDNSSATIREENNMVVKKYEPQGKNEVRFLHILESQSILQNKSSEL